MKVLTFLSFFLFPYSIFAQNKFHSGDYRLLIADGFISLNGFSYSIEEEAIEEINKGDGIRECLVTTTIAREYDTNQYLLIKAQRIAKAFRCSNDFQLEELTRPVAFTYSKLNIDSQKNIAKIESINIDTSKVDLNLNMDEILDEDLFKIYPELVRVSELN